MKQNGIYRIIGFSLVASAIIMAVLAVTMFFGQGLLFWLLVGMSIIESFFAVYFLRKGDKVE